MVNNYMSRLLTASALLFLLSSLCIFSYSEASTALNNEQRSCLVDCRNCERRYGSHFRLMMCAQRCIDRRGRMPPNCVRVDINYDDLAPFLDFPEDNSHSDSP